MRCSERMNRPAPRCASIVAVLLAATFVAAGCAGIKPFASGNTKASAKQAEPVVSAQWRQRYEHALALLQGNHLPEAERELTALATSEPRLAGPYANLGILYFRAGRAAEAAKSLEYAITLNPRAAYYNELGMVQRTEGRFDAAEQAYQHALALDPNYAYAHLNLGILYDLYLQQPERALPHYERYQALAPAEAGTVRKWIVDLKRRTSQAANRGAKGRSG